MSRVGASRRRPSSIGAMVKVNSADGVSIFYEEFGGGEGPAAVLVHGITESSATWGPITGLLAESRRVVTLDLRGHGQSGMADRYDLEAMAGDVAAVCADAGLEAPHLVGHSLGGAVVSAVASVMPVSSVVNVDQMLSLGSFKDQLMPVEPMLRDPATFPAVIEALFAQLAGDAIDPDVMAAVNSARRPVQEVVLGVWELIFTMSASEIDAVVEGALAGFAGRDVPYLSLFGADPGPDYEGWLRRYIDGAVVEVWPDLGHYPHLVYPHRFVERVESFWS